MDGKIPDQPGMKLNEIQIQETKAKFLKHERIVEVMLDEERADPSLLVEDLKALPRPTRGRGPPRDGVAGVGAGRRRSSCAQFEASTRVDRADRRRRWGSTSATSRCRRRRAPPRAEASGEGEEEEVEVPNM